MKKLFRNKNVLITGGTGSVGQELAREILKFRPKVVRVLDIDESRQFELQQRLRKFENVRFLLGDVKDKERLRYAVEGIDILFHVAALKHVESCEYNPFEAVKTNVLGTQNVIDVAIGGCVEKVIFTSSDKAVNPTNVMGATKLLCERLVTAANYYKGARKIVFSSVRFGNVLGSRGSVTHLFKDQIRAGGPLTVTNPNMTRFVMPMPRALKLLSKATGMAQGGEILIFKMPAVKVSDLAKTMIESLAPKYGYVPKDIKMEITGSKPGEKMYEELMTEEEAKRALETKDMFIVLPEMKELLTTKFRYPGARPARVKSYGSSDAKFLTRGEIKRMLREGSLLEV
ncbi:MAG: SDR family NAD(P)-dependent oxidoreductase [Candidatus Hadarchaeaceae archaeon]